MAEYWQLLKDPRWQRKRLEIMQRDDFACRECGANDKTLNVHHGYYEKDKMPWEYANWTMKTLCEDCHEKYETIQRSIKRKIGACGNSLHDLKQILGFVMGICLRECPEISVAWGSRAFVSEMSGVMAAWGLSCSVSDIVEACGEVIRGEDLERLLGERAEEEEYADLAHPDGLV